MAGEPLELEAFLPYRLSVLANLVSTALARLYAERFGLTIPQWRVMAVLGRYPDLSVNQVARKTAMDKVTVSRAVAGLVRDGRACRSTHAGDRRRAVLRLSRDGQEVCARIVPVARAYERRLLNELDTAERRTLERLIDRLARRASSEI